MRFKPYFLQQKHLGKPPTSVRRRYGGACWVTSTSSAPQARLGKTSSRCWATSASANTSKEEMCAWAYVLHRVLGPAAGRAPVLHRILGDGKDHRDLEEAGRATTIYRLGGDDSFWRAGIRAAACSEVYFDQGEDFGCGSPDCAPGCDCDRFLEYWNLVFAVRRTGKTARSCLPKRKFIDTGMSARAHRDHHTAGVQSNYRDGRAAQPRRGSGRS